jgi:hypothetical protein
MPDSERNALGLHIHEGPTLRDRLFDLAASDRRRAALDLGMTPVRPQYRLPSRLPGERRIGYRLSGRGRGWLSEDELFDQLYPATPEVTGKCCANACVIRQGHYQVRSGACWTACGWNIASSIPRSSAG